MTSAMNRITSLLAVLGVFVMHSHAADKGDLADQGTQNQRAYEEFKKVDAELTKAFEHRLDESQKFPALREALIAAQRAWLSFREADAHFESVEGEGGSARTYYVNKRMTYLTKQRIYQLQTPFAQGWVEPVSPGSK
jgi:uncharacterized protein YecT (DUF1311 family)